MIESKWTVEALTLVHYIPEIILQDSSHGIGTLHSRSCTHTWINSKTLLRRLSKITHLILIISLWGRYYYYSHLDGHGDVSPRSLFKKGLNFSTTVKSGLQCPSAAELPCMWSCSSPRQPMSGVSWKRKASPISLLWDNSGGHYSPKGSPLGQLPHCQARIAIGALPLASILPTSSFYRCWPLTNALHFKLFLFCFCRSQLRTGCPEIPFSLLL